MNWYQTRIATLLEPLIHEDHRAEGAELLRKKKVLDSLFSPGSVSAKVQDEASRPHRVTMQWPQIDDAHWEAMVKEMSTSALFLACFLGGTIPPEIEGVAERNGSLFLPRSVFDLKLGCDCEGRGTSCRHRAAVYLRLKERLDEDPFLLLLLCGHGKDETISSLQQLRLSYRRQPVPPAAHQPKRLLPSDINERFWSTPPSTFQLSYKIRADDLPAALLKRLEPIPLGSLETEAEMNLEEAYESVTRRAQAYGLGFTRAKSPAE